MAKMTVKIPEEFSRKLSALGDKTDEILPKVLEAGGEVVLGKVRSNLGGVIGRDTKEPSHSTGQLMAALGLSPAKQTRDGSGWDIKVGFAENRTDGGVNAKIANVLEYGRHGQPARPFLKPAKSVTKDAAVAAMEEKFHAEVARV